MRATVALSMAPSLSAGTPKAVALTVMYRNTKLDGSIVKVLSSHDSLDKFARALFSLLACRALQFLGFSTPLFGGLDKTGSRLPIKLSPQSSFIDKFVVGTSLAPRYVSAYGIACRSCHPVEG